MLSSEEEMKKLPEELQTFLKNISCLEPLREWTERFNIFDVLKISGMEIRHSNMLAWLLDPNETHGWGTSFLKEFLLLFQGGYDWIEEDFLEQCDTFTVRREYKNIDLLLVSEECHTVIAIENKVYSSEHSNQLGRYYDIVCSEYEEGWSKIFIYLTLGGDEASHEAWTSCSHEDILALLDKCKKENRTDGQVLCLIDHYIASLRRILMRDDELIAVCDKIYNEYKKAIDLIMENKTDDQLALINKIKAIVRQRPDILYDNSDTGKTFVHFHTAAMNDLLKPLEADNGSWGKYRYIYSYELMLEPKKGKFKLSIHMALGGWSVPAKEKAMMNAIITQYSTKDITKKADWRHIRVEKSKKHHELSKDSQSVDSIVNDLIDHLLDFERSKILPLLNQR